MKADKSRRAGNQCRLIRHSILKQSKASVPRPESRPGPL
jgi:hypothetical protein